MYQSKVLNNILKDAAYEHNMNFEDVQRIFAHPYIILKDIASRIEPEKVIIKGFGTFSPNISNLKINKEKTNEQR
tara:strand:+ start:2093 stop:2317 length:225 start_codon:yes stop_codon:yes gene_type:complete